MIKHLNADLVAIPANVDVKLSKNFSSKEFGDGVSSWTLIDMRLVAKLQKLRDHLMCPIKVTSGYRSDVKQAALKAKGYETATGPSTHGYGCAVDISTRGRHTGEQLERAARLVGFKAVGVGTGWIHIDIRVDKERRWEYTVRKG